MTWRALVVSAHPDDIEFGCAGTIAKWAREGAEVTICIATDGSTGTQDRSLMGEKLAAIRREEAEKAAAVLGVAEVEWLGLRDGYVTYDLELRKTIARVFRTYRPHRYVVMDPTPTIESRFINHPDHRAIGQASLDVAMTAGTTPGHFPELLDEGLEPWRGLRETWIMGPGQKGYVSDISETIDAKLDALMCHTSQVGPDRDEIADWVRRFSAEIGSQGGYDFGEAFDIIVEGPGFHADEQDDVTFVPTKEPTRFHRD
ncbi:MAG TPA: PIG-L deacetylase family protein, partial [Actinomycetota bacterium]|nr:PIG-L deacetylase family protein [Actinomycetota bacterium]